MSVFEDIDHYFTHMIDKIRRDLTTRRGEDRSLNYLHAVPKAKGVLDVDKVYFYAKENAKAHRTLRYELVHRQPETPILRRGQPFTLLIRFSDDRAYDSAKDVLRLNLNFGPAPDARKLTRGVIEVKDNELFLEDNFAWDAKIVGRRSNELTLKIQIPADAPVGIWKLQIVTADRSSAHRVKIHDCPNDIYILFNPWCHDDSVHMDETEATEEHAGLLEEYVLADVGKIWMGSYGSARGREWVFGQYDDAALPVCVYLLERSGLMHSQRTNPVQVSRVLTKMVNSNDGDNGVLHGRWDGKYSDGTSPSAWTGSVKILEDYLLSRRSVKYGQCWVFAGVLTTLCRALGIPARPVSNIVSAHDSNASLTIDRYYDANNDELDYDPFNPNGGSDSIWNFHVWVEAWMSRPDLPNGYGGWQAIDATPQEQSGGFFQCGPASVQAVRLGQVGLSYDVPFVLAEVNADLVRWREDKSSSIGFVKLSTNKYNIGRQILTKMANRFDGRGQSDTEDITRNYKSSEGTQEERILLTNAMRATRRGKRHILPQIEHRGPQDVIFDLVELDRVPVGQSFSVSIHIQNTSNEKRSVSVVLSATTNYYTGVKDREVKRATGIMILQPMAEEDLRLPVTKEDYLKHLVEYGMMKLNAAASVKETNQIWVEEDDFQMIMPTVDIQVSEAARVGKPLEIVFTFHNSLEMRLTTCKMNFEGPGLCRSDHRNCKDLSANETLTVTIMLTPRYAGSHTLVAVFESEEFTDITGSTNITVTK